VNLGIFPDSNVTAYASAGPLPASARIADSVTTDRLAGIDDLLRAPSPAPAAYQSWTPQTPVATQVAYAAPQPRPAPQQQAAVQRARKIWLQLASGPNAVQFPRKFELLKVRNPDLFDGITGYVALGSDRARLVIGPFRSADDAEIFAENLETVHVDASRWSNSATDRIVPLSAE
jgi:hypothetical protein